MAHGVQIAREMRLSVRLLAAPLGFLQQFGVILSDKDGKDRRYAVAPGYPRRPSRHIDFFSHLVQVNGRERFEVA